jgi:UDP-N-acetylmuramate dehydrogenase
MMSFPEQLKNLIRENVPLAPLSTFQIGGPADFFAEATTEEVLTELIKTAQENKIPFFILGGGSNTLFDDDGFRGLVIKIAMKKITVEGESGITGKSDCIRAESGVLIAQLVQESLKGNLQGLENWVGLPGTVGGAVRGNAGASGLETKDILLEAKILDTHSGEIRIYKTPELHMAYRDSLLKKDKTLIVLEALFQLQKVADIAPLQQTMKDILQKRNTTQPKGKSAGCIFKNPTGTSAGKLIDESGCKGMRVGDIEVSTTHGNFFINHGKGTQKDVLTLIAQVTQRVHEKTGHDLHAEIEMVHA